MTPSLRACMRRHRTPPGSPMGRSSAPQCRDRCCRHRSRGSPWNTTRALLRASRDGRRSRDRSPRRRRARSRPPRTLHHRTPRPRCLRRSLRRPRTTRTRMPRSSARRQRNSAPPSLRWRRRTSGSHLGRMRACPETPLNSPRARRTSCRARVLCPSASVAPRFEDTRGWDGGRSGRVERSLVPVAAPADTSRRDGPRCSIARKAEVLVQLILRALQRIYVGGTDLVVFANDPRSLRFKIVVQAKTHGGVNLSRSHLTRSTRGSSQQQPTRCPIGSRRPARWRTSLASGSDGTDSVQGHLDTPSYDRLALPRAGCAAGRNDKTPHCCGVLKRGGRDSNPRPPA